MLREKCCPVIASFEKCELQTNFQEDFTPLSEELYSDYSIYNSSFLLANFPS